MLLANENGRCSLGYLDPIADLTTSPDDKESPARNETETCNEQSKAADTNSKRCIWPDVYLSIIGGIVTRNGASLQIRGEEREREGKGERREKRQISRQF